MSSKWDACSSNPGTFLWPLSVAPYLLATVGEVLFLGLQFKSARLDNPKAAAHVAETLSAGHCRE